jgi:hypothetical protein
MSHVEVWQCIAESQLTEIKEVLYFDRQLPNRFDGLFVRAGTTALILTDCRLPKHFKEFVAIKEMMHCWSDPDAYVKTPTEAGALVESLIGKGRYTASVAADNGAILAAAEVILPHGQVEWHHSVGHDHAQIAVHHNLHPEIVELICRFDVLHARKNGHLL